MLVLGVQDMHIKSDGCEETCTLGKMRLTTRIEGFCEIREDTNSDGGERLQGYSVVPRFKRISD